MPENVKFRIIKITTMALVPLTLALFKIDKNFSYFLFLYTLVILCQILNSGRPWIIFSILLSIQQFGLHWLNETINPHWVVKIDFLDLMNFSVQLYTLRYLDQWHMDAHKYTHTVSFCTHYEALELSNMCISWAVEAVIWRGF